MPTGGYVKTHTLFSVVRMIKQIQYDWQLITQTGCLIHKNREILVEKALENNCTHVLFVDSDMLFDGDALDRLMERNKEIIGVPTHLRKFPLVSTMKNIDEFGNKLWEEYPDGLIKCAGVGTGFMLINLEVFKNITHPWFFYESNDNGDLVCGEDMWFCRKARAAGYDIWADSTVNVGHIGDMIF